MDLQLTKKLALVSGSTAGIGNAIAESLAREGATVIVNGRTSEAVAAAVTAIKAATGGDVIGFAGDLSSASVADNCWRSTRRSRYSSTTSAFLKSGPLRKLPTRNGNDFLM